MNKPSISFCSILLVLSVALLYSCSGSKKIVAEKPQLASSRFNLDSLPSSEINIPIRINLRPIYAMAESKVDTMFTSPDYPNAWLQEDCATRYKYRFRRSPLHWKAVGNRFDLGFTGYYRITGSTRVCVAGKAISSWTSPCTCGYDEPERRVNVSFSNSFSVLPDYKIKLQVKRNEPEALDKCEVCFWGQDITNTVLKGLSSELDLAKAELEKEYGLYDFKAQFYEVWKELSKPFDLFGQGWLKINPQRIHLNNLYAKNDSLYIYLGLSAKPQVSLEKPLESESTTTPYLPSLSTSGRMDGFSIFVDAELNYDSLSRIMNAQVSGKSFDFKKGPVNKKFVIQKCQLIGAGNEKMIVKVDFSGSNSGTVYLTGKPVFNPATRILEITDLDFDIKTRNALLSTADWLFNRRIVNEISRQTRFDVGAYLDSARVMVNEQFNREWYPGLFTEGSVNDIRLIGVYPQQNSLHIRSNAKGILSIRVEDLDVSL